MSDVRVFSPAEAAAVRDLRPDVVGPDGRMRVLPASFWADTTPEERAQLGHHLGVYSFPTVELVALLEELIDGRPALEIGAGHGVLADALGILGTDNRQQEKEPWRSQLLAAGQPPVQYGPNVIECSAADAVRRWRPRVVIGCWVSHRFSPERAWAGGNEIGVDELDILANCDTYVFVGNQKVHDRKVIWSVDHNIESPHYLVSRALNGSSEFIAVWQGTRRGGKS